MKKLITVVLALTALAFIMRGSAQAEEKYVAGGFEASGHVVTGAGYTHHNKKAGTEFAFDGDIGSTSGVLGRYLVSAIGAAAPGAAAVGNDTFKFFVDEAELDLTKSFGENIKLRTDLDFGRFGSGSTAAFILEQAYATANIPVGNGLEILLGRFNTPIGFESVDVSDNDTISKSILSRGLRPSNTTGAKLYYSFSDLVDLHLYVVNTLFQDFDTKVNDIPSAGFRLGFNWGEEGQESTFGVSGLFGPETRLSNKHFTFGGDVDVNWWATEAFAVGAEAIFTRNDAFGGTNTEYMAGLLNLHYAFSDVWDGTLKYAFAKQFDPTNLGAATAWTNLTGAEQAIHEASLAGGYEIADGAKLKLEGRIDMVNPPGGGNTQYIYGGAWAFAYNF